MEDKELDPQSMIEALNQPTGTEDKPFELPTEIAGLGQEDYMKGLSVISGGAIENYDGFSDLMKKANRFESLEKDHQSLQEKYNTESEQFANRFANDYVKELNALYDKGAKQSEIDLFVKMQNLDLDNMSPTELLKLHKSMEFPDLTKSEVEAAFGKKYGDPEDWTDGDKAMMKQEALSVKKDLVNLKVASGKPDSLKEKENFERTQQQTFNYWNDIEKTIEVSPTYKISEKLSGDETFEFDYKLPEGALKDLKQARMYHLMSGRVKKGDAAGFKKEMAAFTENFIYGRYGKEMLRLAIEENRSQVKLKANQRHHNTLPAKEGKDANAPKMSDATEAHLERIRANALK